jgi:phage shock protein E
MKQLIYLALVIVCGAALLKWVSRRSVPTGGGWKTLTPEEAKARLDSGDAVTLLDVRTEAEYEESHIPGAVCLPVESIGTQPPASLPDPDAEILVYCRSGRRSAQAATKLAKLGYTNVSDFGGILNWPYETTTD